MRLAQLTALGWAKFIEFGAAWGEGKIETNGRPFTSHTASFLVDECPEKMMIDRIDDIMQGKTTVHAIVSIIIGVSVSKHSRIFKLII